MKSYKLKNYCSSLPANFLSVSSIHSEWIFLRSYHYFTILSLLFQTLQKLLLPTPSKSREGLHDTKCSKVIYGVQEET